MCELPLPQVSLHFFMDDLLAQKRQMVYGFNQSLTKQIHRVLLSAALRDLDFAPFIIHDVPQYFFFKLLIHPLRYHYVFSQ